MKKPVNKELSPSFNEQKAVKKRPARPSVGSPAVKKNTLAGAPAAGAPAEQNLRGRLIEAAARSVAESGVAGVKARDVATYAGCSLGMIYYVFEDLDALIIALNHETRNRLDEALKSVLIDDPRENLDRLALGYLRFAHDNKQLWRAIFEFRARSGRPVPEDYRTDIMITFSRIALMLEAVFPERGQAEIDMSARALFSAVHGIVALGLDENYVAVPLAQMEDRLCRFVATFMIGMLHETPSKPRPKQRKCK